MKGLGSGKLNRAFSLASAWDSILGVVVPGSDSGVDGCSSEVVMVEIKVNVRGGDCSFATNTNL